MACKLQGLKTAQAYTIHQHNTSVTTGCCKAAQAHADWNTGAKHMPAQPTGDCGPTHNCNTFISSACSLYVQP
jgi:hypothetical protein